MTVLGWLRKNNVTRNQMANRDLQRGDKTGHGWNHLAMHRYTHRICLFLLGPPINGRKSMGNWGENNPYNAK